MYCIYSEDTESKNTVKCNLGLYGGYPHIGVCIGCEKREDIERTDKDITIDSEYRNIFHIVNFINSQKLFEFCTFSI